VHKTAKSTEACRAAMASHTHFCLWQKAARRAHGGV